MNLVIFEPGEADRPLAGTDPRALHLRNVLRCGPGDSFDAGVVNGPRGRGTILSVGPEAALHLAFRWGPPPPPPDPLRLVLGLPRPQTARDILREVTTLGVAELDFVLTEKSDRNYHRSPLWQGGQWRRHLLAGAAQAADTRVPAVRHGGTLAAALNALAPGGIRLALDNYEAAQSLAAVPFPANLPVVLALGPERGWAAGDRAGLRAAGFHLVHLGPRVLRLETAVVAALVLVKAARGSL